MEIILSYLSGSIESLSLFDALIVIGLGIMYNEIKTVKKIVTNGLATKVTNINEMVSYLKGKIEIIERD